MNFIIRLLISAAAAYGLSMVLSGVHIPDFKDALIFALILGLLNVFLKPILVLFTLPVTIVTLGLFLLVINAIIVLLAAKFMDGVQVDNILWALIFSLLLSVVTSAVSSLFTSRD